MYLAYWIRPNITFVVGQLNKHNADLRKDHLQTVKRVVEYLKGIIQMRLVFRRKIKDYLPRNPPLYGLTNYIDSNFIRDPEN